MFLVITANIKDIVAQYLTVFVLKLSGLSCLRKHQKVVNMLTAGFEEETLFCQDLKYQNHKGFVFLYLVEPLNIIVLSQTVSDNNDNNKQRHFGCK
jgi:hypothetical protein